MDSSDLIVLTPAGNPDPVLAIAAVRAGARGTLDLEYAATEQPAAIERLARQSRGPFGVKLGANVAGTVAALLRGPRPGWVILAGGVTPGHCESASQLRAAGIEVFAEAVSIAEASAAVAWGIDGLILKGHEAGGRVGSDTSFVLIQAWRKHAAENRIALPFWVQGGVGPNTAAACLAGGARGVVLDSQLLLARESSLSDAARKRVAGLDGGETLVLGARIGMSVRLYGRADSPAAQELLRDEERPLTAGLTTEEARAGWLAALRERVDTDPAAGAWLVGQDIVLAAGLATKGVTVAGILQHVREATVRQLDLSRRSP
ncbi:MAG TPA: nitronate monooxygenase, partial [Urbifossiella sp.]|nr:nitronate monooxygenase [Urbifossiella sp.]